MRPLNKLSSTVLALLTAGACVETQAVEPANLILGPMYVAPTVDTRLQYTDNLFRSPDDKKTSGFSVIRPRVQAWLENGFDTYSFTYTLTDYRYFNSDDDDFVDHQFNIDVHHEFNARNVWNVYGEFLDGHQQRGTGLSEGLAVKLIDEPIEFERITAGTDYTIGSQSSKGRAVLTAKYHDTEYQNFRGRTRYRDYDQYVVDGTFYWKVASKTDIVAEMSYQEARYDLVNPLQSSSDSEEYNYLLGVSWEPTAKTSGSVKLGWYERSYESEQREDSDGFSWAVDVSYSLRSYSVFNLQSSRSTQESNGRGDAVNTQTTRLAWNHTWTSRSSTNLAATFSNQDTAGSTRQDDVYAVQVKYNYAMRRWLDLGIGYSYEERKSAIDQYDYDRNTIFVEAKFSL